MPSKNVIHSAKVAELARHAAEFGVITQGMTVEMRGVRARKRRMVEGEVRLHLELYKASGVELIRGEARFIGPKTVEVRLNEGGLLVLTGDQVFLDVGTHAASCDAADYLLGKTSEFNTCQSRQAELSQLDEFGLTNQSTNLNPKLST